MEPYELWSKLTSSKRKRSAALALGAVLLGGLAVIDQSNSAGAAVPPVKPPAISTFWMPASVGDVPQCKEDARNALKRTGYLENPDDFPTGVSAEKGSKRGYVRCIEGCGVMFIVAGPNHQEAAKDVGDIYMNF